MTNSPITVHVEEFIDQDFVSLRLEVNDYELLAQLLIEVALGNASHAAEILAGTSGYSSERIRSMAASSALKLFQLQANDDSSHRDGWMFQVMSWIASQESYPGALQNVPHIRHAHKGLDGLCIVLNDNEDGVAFCVVFEDKATSNARSTFRDKVLPELESFESGAETTLLTDGITSLLTNSVNVDRDAAIESILWNKKLRYRVSTTTVTNSHITQNGRAVLFKGFSTSVPGNRDRRIGVIMHDQEIRVWFAELARRCQALLVSRGNQDV